MKKKFGGMTLAAMLLLASPSAQADNNGYGNTFVGDLGTDHSVHVADRSVAPISNYAPVSIGDLQPAGWQSTGCSGCDTGVCDGGCDSGCDSMGCDSRGPIGKRMAKALNMCEKDGWIRAEGLIMFMKDRRSPPLVTSNDPGLFTSLDQAGVVTEFGGDLDGGVSGGFRTDVGRYLSDGFGVGGRFTWIGENGDDYSAAGDGSVTSRSLGIPHFDTNIADENAEIVNQANQFAGNVNASFATEIYGAEAYARLDFMSTNQARIEMIGGYSYWNVEDRLSLNTSRTDVNTLATTIRSSLWDTENEFNGGQIGFDSSIRRGCWSARMLSKIHLGNMQRTVNISGATVQGVGVPPAPLAGQVTTNSSLLVDARQGSETSDEFAFIPELNFTLGYRFRDHVSFTVGYNFMYFDEIALAGEQVNRIVDGTAAGAAVAPAGFDIVDGSLWIQGIAIGASVDY